MSENLLCSFTVQRIRPVIYRKYGNWALIYLSKTFPEVGQHFLERSGKC